MTEGIYRRIAPLLGASVLLAISVCAQQAPLSYPKTPRYANQRLADHLGLSAVTVTSMEQDGQGFLWIGTQTGVYRYDGTRARKMTEIEPIVGHYIEDINVAPDGTPWLAGSRGIAYYRNGEFKKVPIPNEYLPLAGGSQIFTVDRRGVVYALLFHRGILRIDPEDPAGAKVFGKERGVDENTGGIALAADDSVWFASGDKLGHISRDGKTLGFDEGIQLPKDRVTGLIWDGRNNLWMRSSTHLAKLDPVHHTLTYEKAVEHTANMEEGEPSLDRQGRLMVPSSAGLYWQTEDGWRLVTTDQGLTSNDVQCAIEDREGALWVAGSGVGLDRLAGVHEWAGWTTDEGLPDNATWSTLRDHQGRLWVSTSSGVAFWDNQARRWRQVETAAGDSQTEVRQIQLAGDGSIWALTAKGMLVRIDAVTLQRKSFANFAGKNFLAEQAAPDGSIWVTLSKKLIRFPGKSAADKPEEIALPIGSLGEVEYLSFSPDGVLWATGPATLYRYDGKSWRTFGTQDGLQGENLTSVVGVSESEAWLGYNDVLSVTHLKLKADGAPQMDHHAWDWTILAHDSKGRVWFDGTDGLAMLSPDGKITRFDHTDGLIWDDVSPWAGLREEADGSYVIATSRGLARYQPAATAMAHEAPSVAITSVMLGGKDHLVNERPDVRTADGALAVEFTPMVMRNPEHVRCSYQLKGLDSHETQTMTREVRYAGLPAGNYEFAVRCESPETGAISAPASFKFRVLPSFWQTWWARALGGVVLLFAFWGFVLLRTRALNKRRLELEAAVDQRSTELLQKNKELEEISLTDPLTATRNRRYFYETIPKDVAQTQRSHLRTSDPNQPAAPKQDLIFVLIDIDRFKRVNDELGHASGDRLLKEVATRISSVMRKSDDLVRWGGEEFLLVCRTTGRENAHQLCNRVLEAVREAPFEVGNGLQIHKSCSIGWAPFPWHPDDVGMLSVDNVIELADRALYLAKREGRNRSFGMVPAANLVLHEKNISMQALRECPPDLVQIV